MSSGIHLARINTQQTISVTDNDISDEILLLCFLSIIWIFIMPLDFIALHSMFMVSHKNYLMGFCVCGVLVVSWCLYVSYQFKLSLKKN